MRTVKETQRHSRSVAAMQSSKLWITKYAKTIDKTIDSH